jgi:hypothetical protein
MPLATHLRITKQTAFRCLGDPARPVRGRALSQHSHPENAEAAVFIHIVRVFSAG